MGYPRHVKAILEKHHIIPPDTKLPVYIDSSMRSTYLACGRQFLYQYILDRSPDVRSIHLHAGGAFAKGCEVIRFARYKEGLSWPDSIEKGQIALFNEWSRAKDVDSSGTGKSLDNMIMLLEEYFEHYDMQNHCDILPYIEPSTGNPAVEYSFALPIPEVLHPETGDPFLYVGRYDMVGERRQRASTQKMLYVTDEKTCQAIGPNWAKQWALRGQFTGYCWAAKQFGYPVVGACVRGIKITKTGNFGFAEHITTRPDWQIAIWYEQLVRDLKRLVRDFEEGYFDFNLDHSCASYSGCPFQVVCDSREPEKWLEASFTERTWNPVTGED